MEELKERLNKILEGCEKCKAKMCSLCPNGAMKKKIRAELKKRDDTQERGVFAWLKRVLKD